MKCQLITLASAFLLASAGAAVAANPPVAPVGLGSGLGCGAQCIEKAWVTPGVSGATVEVKSDTPAAYTVKVSDQAPGYINDVPWIPSPDDSAQTWLPALGHTFTLDGLTAGTLYHLLVTAEDTEGRTAYRLGTFSTLEPPPLPPAVEHENGRTVAVTFFKVKVLNDADKGSANKGEISFDYYVNGDWVLSNEMRKLKSGDSITPHDPEWPVGDEDAPELLTLKVRGTECDNWSIWAGWNCVEEAGDEACVYDSSEDRACATVSIDLTDLSQGALPGNYGTGMPAGHDGYVVFETPDDYYLEFRVYAYFDVSEGV